MKSFGASWMSLCGGAPLPAQMPIMSTSAFLALENTGPILKFDDVSFIRRGTGRGTCQFAWQMSATVQVPDAQVMAMVLHWRTGSLSSRDGVVPALRQVPVCALGGGEHYQ